MLFTQRHGPLILHACIMPQLVFNQFYILGHQPTEISISWLYGNGSQDVVHIPAASAWPGDLQERNILRPHPRPTALGPSNLFLKAFQVIVIHADIWEPGNHWSCMLKSEWILRSQSSRMGTFLETGLYHRNSASSATEEGKLSS